MIDIFSKIGQTVHLTIKISQTITNSFENFLLSSKRSPNSTETYGGTEFLNKIFTDFLIKHNIKRYSRSKSLGAVFVERFNRTIRIEKFNRSIRDILKEVVFERDDANCSVVLPTMTKHYNTKIHSSTQLTPIEGSLKKA